MRTQVYRYQFKLCLVRSEILSIIIFRIFAVQLENWRKIQQTLTYLIIYHSIPETKTDSLPRQSNPRSNLPSNFSSYATFPDRQVCIEISPKYLSSAIFLMKRSLIFTPFYFEPAQQRKTAKNLSIWYIFLNATI